MKTRDGASGPQTGDYINLKVVGPANQEVHFRIKRSTPLRRVMEAYCERQGQDMESFQFWFDGERVAEKQTPAELKMEDGDSIDAMVKQVGC